MSRRWGVIAVLAVAVLAGTAACGDTTPKAAPQPTATPKKDPLASCTEQLVYWAGENLRRAPDQAYDYQHMGLTAEKYDELRKIQQAARSLKDAGKLPPTWLQEQSKAACVRILATPAPSNTAGGWPQ
ncbi:hypothetical protein AB0P21_02970 [Kribbella sp. NPDC056861]|uniref:hypothetical protein n=1 Tax=Kribbella sp. NPDC056861 TaxID=3154857 RepID=UPI0034463B6A